MKYAFIDQQRVAFSVSALCRALGVSRSGFHDWLAKPATERERRDERLARKIEALFRFHKGRYGSPRVHHELRASGERVSEKRVARIMQEKGLVARAKKAFVATTNSAHEDPIAPNLLKRNFVASVPNQVWVTDVTFIATFTGWVYLAVIVDLFSRRIVGWATSMNNDRHLALDALRRAVVLRQPPPGLIHHSDRGSVYASDDYRAELTRFGMIASMSRKGDCWDNAVAESLFSTIKTESLAGGMLVNHDAVNRVLREYIDEYYNPIRRHSYISYTTPISFELQQSLDRVA